MVFRLNPLERSKQYARMRYTQKYCGSPAVFSAWFDSLTQGLRPNTVEDADFELEERNIADYRRFNGSFFLINGIYALPEGLFTLGLLEFRGTNFPGVEIITDKDKNIDVIVKTYIQNVVACSQERLPMEKKYFNVKAKKH